MPEQWFAHDGLSMDALAKCMGPPPPAGNDEESAAYMEAWGIVCFHWSGRFERDKKIKQEQDVRAERVREERRLRQLEQEKWKAQSALTPGGQQARQRGQQVINLPDDFGGPGVVWKTAPTTQPNGPHFPMVCAAGGYKLDANSPSIAAMRGQGPDAMPPAKPKPPEALRHTWQERSLLFGTQIGDSRANMVFIEAGCPDVSTYLRYDPQGPFAGGILEWMYSTHWDWAKWGFAEDGEKVFKADWFAVPSPQDESAIFVPRLARIKDMRRAPPRIEAFAEAFRAVNRNVWSVIHDSLESLRALREATGRSGRVPGLVAESMIGHAHFGSIEAQVRWGNTKLRLPSHVDGATSLLHLGLTLGGKRKIRAGVFTGEESDVKAEENVWDEETWNQENLVEVNMAPGRAYLSSPFCFEHAVEYEETVDHDPVIALQFRFAFKEEGPELNNIRDDPVMNEVTRIIAVVLKVAADGEYIRMPSLEEVKSAEARLAAGKKRMQREAQQATAKAAAP